MSTAALDAGRQKVVEREVEGLLARSKAFAALPLSERDEIRRNTLSVAQAMVENRMQQAEPHEDPYAIPMGPVSAINTGGGAAGSTQPAMTGGATQRQEGQLMPKSSKDFGAALATGVVQAGELLRQVNFPAFVAELIRGVFNAVVDASIQQMKAYGELVQSVTMSLNDFRDQNVSDNQGRDHLVSKYPTLMQMNIVDGQPRVGMKSGADEDALPNFKRDLGLDEDVTSLDDETIEEKLVPAARNDLARSRQSLLATMVLMGINRIIVTDGKINAKLKFDFHARDTQQNYAQNFDYQNMGTTTSWQGENESTSEGGSWSRDKEGAIKSDGASRWSKGTFQYAQTPAIYLTSMSETTTAAELEASAKLAGEVSLNFKSETFDLNKLASADQVFRLERVRGAGHGAPPAGAGAATEPATTGAPASGGTPATSDKTAATTP